jgi:hypothetical protein
MQLPMIGRRLGWRRENGLGPGIRLLQEWRGSFGCPTQTSSKLLLTWRWFIWTVTLPGTNPVYRVKTGGTSKCTREPGRGVSLLAAAEITQTLFTSTLNYNYM